MVSKQTKPNLKKPSAKKGKKPGAAKAVKRDEHQPVITLMPGASSCSSINYYANNDEEREAASARFRAAVSKSSSRTKRSK
jgi:hypothetical protein